MAQVVFLRGVNVGGSKTFQPSVVARKLKALDLVNVGAAGTFVARKAISTSALRAELIRTLPVECEIMICSGAELIKVADAAVFKDQEPGPDIVRFVSVLGKRPQKLPPLPRDFPEDAWVLRLIAVQDRFVFGVYRRQMQAIGYLNQIEKVFKAPTTSRNWNTISKVIGILRAEK